MRILQVSDKANHDGGIAAYVAATSARLEARGHRIVHLRLENDLLEGSDPAVSVYRLPTSYGFIPGQLLRRALRKVLRETQPDLIHVHECFTTLSPVLLAEMHRFAPVVGTLHDIRPFCYLMTRRFSPTGMPCHRTCGIGCFASGCVRPEAFSDLARLPRRWVMDRLSLNQWRRIDRVIAPSSYLQELALQHGIAARNLRLVPHGTDVPPTCASWTDRATPATVLYLGGLLEYKGPGVLVEALGSIRKRNWQAVIAGDGPLRAPLEEKVQRLGLRERIRFCGHLGDRRQISSLLSSARLLALPSLIPESFSLAGIEALAAGTPVVSFGLGGMGEWLRDGENGLVAAAGDANDLARQMSRLIDDRALAEAMGRRGYALVARRFSADKAVDGLLAVYGELTGVSA